MLVELHAKTDVGRVRRGNEDNFLLLDLTAARAWSGSDGPENPEDMREFPLGEHGMVLVVSDGMGGALAGDVASRWCNNWSTSDKSAKPKLKRTCFAT